MKCIAAITTCLASVLFAMTATAFDGVEVIETHGELRHHVNIAPSPTPGYCYWESGEVPLTFFHATETDGYGNMDCAHPWLVHSDADSLVYRGTWPAIDSEYVTGASYRVDLSYSVVLTRIVKLAARLIYEGDLTTSTHSMIVDMPGGNRWYSYAAPDGPHNTWTELNPGAYTINFHVDASGESLTPYEGYVGLKWEEPDSVPTEALSWGSVKALYRD